MAKCPKCGSLRFEYKLRTAGADVSSSYYRKLNRRSSSWVIPAGQKNVSVKHRNSSIGFCPDCGYMQEYKPPMSKGGKVILYIIMGILIISILLGITDKTPKDESIWAHEVTPLDQFEHVIDGSNIHLGKYTGKSNNTYIGLEYTVDGETMPVTEIGCHFRSINSCIIPDGATEIENSMFNGSSVKYLYLPASLKNFKGWSYFHDLEYLYYGGNEQAFIELHGSGNTSHLVSKRIYYNASIEDIIKQDIEEHAIAELNAQQ